MAGERKLQAPTQDRTMHRSDDWLGRLFDCRQYVWQVRSLQRQIELFDIGTGDEGTAFTHDDYCPNINVTYRLFKARQGNCSRTSRDRALTGGLLMMIRPTSPSR
ncbi:hypothetical protein PPS11_22834 [Pseudomonas putida S11]|nr:hypothetical protein PPS11_22834 [Pseudomonas putida S11]